MSPSSDPARELGGGPGAIGTGVAERVVVLPVDLHARPAGRLVRAAAGFGSTMTLLAGERSADARSVLAVMGLTATAGTEVTVRAAGADAETAADALAGVLASAD